MRSKPVVCRESSRDNRESMERKIAFVFPGQGSQSVGMGQEFAARFDDFAEIYSQYLKKSDEILGFEISELMKNGPESQLKQTEITQPALLICSCAMADWLAKHGVKAQMALGHSLGEYSALVAADSLHFDEALPLVHLRGRLMAEAIPHGEGGMLALMGASRDEAQEICDDVLKAGESHWVLAPSVFNTSGQVVVSGHQAAILEAQKAALNHGIRRAIELEVSGPFHCELLRPAGEKLEKALEAIEIRRPSIRVTSNVTALCEFNPSEIRANLVKQVFCPVLWSDCVHYAGEEGITDFIEVGSGRVLTGLIKKILPDAKCLALDGLERLELLAA